MNAHTKGTLTLAGVVFVSLALWWGIVELVRWVAGWLV